MSLNTPDGPAQGPGLVSQAVEDLQPPKRLGRDLFRSRPRPAASRPLAIYRLDVADLALASPLVRAQAVGWRYVVRQGAEAFTVDLAGAEPDELRFHALRRGDRAARLLKACEVAQTLAGPRRDYEVRVLGIPPLRLEALWLKGKADDRFVRLKAPTQPEIEPFDLLETARGMTSRRAAAQRSEAPDVGG
ncbi:MAG: hypothetical protein ABI655_04185 [Phenylobacterium sp.]